LNYMAKAHTYILTDKKGNDVFEMIDRLDTICKLHF
jgi:hypothetical protein